MAVVLCIQHLGLSRIVDDREPVKATDVRT
jgi:hypothetical protein